MSRIGKEPIPIPSGIKVSVKGARVVAEGPKGRVEQDVVAGIGVKIEDDVLHVTRKNDSREQRAFHGLTRALLANAVHGVAEGFERKLEINGVGYRGEVKGKEVHFALGYSHPVVYPIPEGIEIDVDKNNTVTIKGANNQQVGQVAAEIRALRKPEPYKGKGIKYADEIIRRKAGKAGAT